MTQKIKGFLNDSKNINNLINSNARLPKNVFTITESQLSDILTHKNVIIYYVTVEKERRIRMT